MCLRRNLSITVFVEVLLLNSRAEVERSVVYEIGTVLGQIQQHEIEVEPNHTKLKIIINNNNQIFKFNQTHRGCEKRKMVPPPAKIQDDLRVETDGPGNESEPTQSLVHNFEFKRIPRGHFLRSRNRNHQLRRCVP